LSICGRCGGVNISDEVCPECGLPPRTSKIKEKVQVQDISQISEKIDSLNIPKFYLGKNWSAEMFWYSHENKRRDKLVCTYIDQMEKVHTMFKNGTIPQRSAIFIAPADYSKLIFAYSCMQYALKHDYTVAPILDTLEIKRLFILSSEKPNQNFLGLNYEDFVNADVLFFTVTKTEYRRAAYSIIVELLDKRARRGKCTIGISRYTVYELSNWDTSNDFRQILKPVNDIDLLKTPAIISCI